uniref:ERCC excision repair 6 like 2 n=1 Tax=Anolis carolinensis TaxID=28377 RepID=A0A803TIG7_ANOCA
FLTPGKLGFLGVVDQNTWESTDQWHVGDKCLVPLYENEKLCDATITSLETDKNGKLFAIVSFEASQEKKVLVTKLQKIKTTKDTKKYLIFDDEDLEKPYFPDRRLPSPAVGFQLSKDGHQIPYTINRYLRDYQREGAQFLHGHYVRKRGCILGDDMGLGKTVQVISFLAAMLNKKGARADIENNMPEFLRTMKNEMSSVPKKIFLIVSPLSVLYNWKDELDTWGYFKVIVLHGNKKDYELNRIKKGKCEIALTTYETLRLFLDELNSLEWSAVIVDEVHRIKNPKAQITQTMKALTCKVRLGLTGTILQNNMKELWCVMDWAVPGLLGNEARFKKEFSDPVEHGQRHTATKRELATGRKAMQKLAKQMSGYFLRRTKALINDQLPKKEDRMVYCSLTEFQRAVYKAVLETEDVRLVLQARKPCSCNSGRKRKNCCYKTNVHGETMQALYFSYLTILRKIANHTGLLQIDNTSKQQEAHIRRVCEEVFSKFPDFVQLSKDAAFETISDPKYSGKMKVLQKLLNHFRKNKDKVLLFSFSTKLLDVLEQYCMASGLDYRRLDGNTKAEDRVKIVKEFNGMEEVNICLVSTMAGGLGLNFVGANIVILFDPTWNPANDLQAIDRAYRIGQCRDVKVFRLISLGTVEEMMYLRQVYKQQLHCVVVGSENAKRYFEAVQGSKEHQGELFGIHNLFRFQDHGSCLTKEILEREGKVEAGVMTATTWLEEEPQSFISTLKSAHGHEDQETVSSKESLEKEGLDCSSDFSDEESVQNCKVKGERNRLSNAKNTKTLQGQLTLMQCGFPKLLEKRSQTAEEDSSSDENVDGQFMKKSSKCISLSSSSLKSEGHCNISQYQTTTPPPYRMTKQEECIENVYYENPVEKNDKDRYISNQVGIVQETEASSSENEDVVKSYKGTNVKRECLHTEKSPKLTPLQKHLISEQRSRGASTFSKIKSFKTIPKTKTVKEASDISDESDDIEMPKTRVHKFNTSVKKSRFHNKKHNNPSRITLYSSKLSTEQSSAESQNIEEFSSSEDNSVFGKADVNKQKLKGDKCQIQFKSGLSKYSHHPSVLLRKRSNSDRLQTPLSKEATPNQRRGEGSLDKLLDDVAEVSYIHSNQNVVGASKAENQMSRWAVRDVFELQQFSQLPANVAVWRAKVKKKAPSKRKDTQKSNLGSEITKPTLLCISHPVCQKQKRIHRIGSRTFLLGRTPKRIRRKQFEEMASHFHKNPVEDFARYITRATSEERQKMVKAFYGEKYPELKDLLKIEVPVCAAEGSEETDVHRPLSRKGKSISKNEKSKSDPSADVCVQKRHDAEGKQFQYYPCIQAAVGRNSQAFKDFMASDSLSSKSGIIEGLSANTTKGQPNLKGTQSPRKPFSSQLENRQTQICEENSFTDLLGDTSILHDLFKGNESRPREPPRRSLSQPAEKAKTRAKDFWDMLNEQNEEGLQKLTDLAVVEKLCETPLSKKKKEEQKPLWKKNDNFLWKRYSTSDTDEET